jgi:hypothetical protein
MTITTCGGLEWCQGWRPQKPEVVDEVVVRQKSGGTYGRRVDVARGTTEETRGISAERRGLSG